MAKKREISRSKLFYRVRRESLSDLWLKLDRFKGQITLKYENVEES